MVINTKNIIFVLTLLIIGTIWLCVELEQDKGINTHNEDLNSTARLVAANDATLEQMIINYSIENGINYETSLRIANCESKMGKYKTNWEGSSAYGLYQFMPRTFNAYCQGSIESDIDQIRCFTKLYKSHPSWWLCS